MREKHFWKAIDEVFLNKILPSNSLDEIERKEKLFTEYSSAELLEITVSHLEHNEFEDDSIRKNFERYRVYSLKSFADEGLLRKPSYAKGGFNKKSGYKNVNQVTDANVGKTNCFSCGKPGHFARDCQLPAHKIATTTTTGCFSCGKQGHFARDCTAKKVQNVSAECYNCGIVGHFSRDCTKNTSIKLVNKQGKQISESSKEKIQILKDHGVKCTNIICFMCLGQHLKRDCNLYKDLTYRPNNEICQKVIKGSRYVFGFHPRESCKHGENQKWGKLVVVNDRGREKQSSDNWRTYRK